MRIVRPALLPLVLLLAAAAPPAQAESKIAAFRTDVVMRDAPQLKAAEARFKAEFEKREKELQAEGKKLGEDIKKFQREADTMTAQQRADTEKGLNTRKIDFDLKQRQFAEEAQARNQELLRDLRNRINKAIEDVAREKGIELVLQDPAYLAPAVDITGDVLKKLQSDTGAADAKKKK